AWFLQSGPVLLLPRLVGGRHYQSPVSQSGEMERTAKIVSGNRGSRRRLRKRRRTSSIRRAQPTSLEASGCQRRTAAAFLAGDHGGLSEGLKRGKCRNVCLERKLQEGLGLADGISPRPISLVAGRRIRV